jgi:hypothetical protein
LWTLKGFRTSSISVPAEIWFEDEAGELDEEGFDELAELGMLDSGRIA